VVHLESAFNRLAPIYVQAERTPLKIFPIETNKDGVFVGKEPKSWF